MKYQAYKFRLYPDKDQAALIQRTFGCCRVVWNLMLQDAKASYKATKKFSYRTPAGYKAEHPYLRIVDSIALGNVWLNLRSAFSRFFKGRRDKKKTRKSGFPRWKTKKHPKRSYTTNRVKGCSNVGIEQGRLRLPKLGLLKVVFHRRVTGELRSATVSQNAAGHYFVSILTRHPDDAQIKCIDTSSVVGIDMSFANIAVYHDGSRLKHPRWFRSAERRLARASRKLHHRKKGSRGRDKAREQLARIHNRIANQRRDYLHKESRRLVDQYDVIVVEDINLAGLAKRGRRRRFGKSIHDMSFGMFRLFLQYKAELQGKLFCKADRFYPSTQLCCVCRERNLELRGNLSIRQWCCSGCGAEHDRDQNAAQNLVVWFHERLAAHLIKNNTGASPGIYADGDLAATGSCKAAGKSSRRNRKSCGAGSHKPTPQGAR